MTPINVCTSVMLVVNRFAQNVYVYYAYGWCCSQKVVPQNLGSQLASQKVMASFELALVQSLVLQFPSSEIQGCFFHFFQRLWMKVQFIGLTDLYKNDPVTHCFSRKKCCISFCATSNSLEWSQCRCTSDSQRRCPCRLFPNDLA